MVDESPVTLRGHMGTFELLATVLAFTAPLGVVFGFLSYNIRFGVGVPIAFLGVALLMAVFSVGFTSMARHLPRPGAFYTYIAEGLGRPLGLGASFLALATYGFNIASALVFAGIAVNNLLGSFSLAPIAPWWVWSLLMLAIVWCMSYFNVELSAKVLTVALVIEVLAILVFDVVVILAGGPEGHSLEPWNPASLNTPNLGLLLLFSIGLFNGFEATAVYRDEVRQSAVTIPRATFLAVGFLGIFYAVSAYALILSAGVTHASSMAATDPAGMMPKALLHYFGPLANQVISMLLLSSMFASSLSVQNILARYTHSLGVDGILPRSLGKVHPKHGSPHIAAMAVGATVLVVLVLLIASKISELDLYGAAAGIAFYDMLLLLLLTAVAVVFYFKTHQAHLSTWQAFVAPFLAAVGIAIEVVTATSHIDLLIPAPPLVTWILIGANYALIALGVVVAIQLRKRGSPSYARIGRRLG